MFRCVAFLRGENAERLASAVGVRVATISAAWRNPQRVSKPLRKKLERHFNTSWDVLSGTVSGHDVAASLMSKAAA